MTEERYDVVVLGGGTAGSNAARTAHAFGKKVAMVYDPSAYQNLCIELGCMPSKSLIGSAELGLTLTEALKRKDEHIERFMRAFTTKMESDGYVVVPGRGTFQADTSLKVAHEGQTKVLKGDRYIIATGSYSFVPPIPGLDTVPYFTSDDVMRSKVTELPKRLIVLGGGPIGLELGSFFAHLGSDVTIVDLGTLLKPFDPEFGEELRRVFESQGIQVFESSAAENISQEGDVIKITIKTNEAVNTYETDALMLATGRRPNVEDLGLEHLGLQFEKGQLVECTAHMCSSNEVVFAAGDVTRDIELLHVAAEEGKVAGWNAAGGEPRRSVDYDSLKLFVVFTDPPVAHIGLSERDAQEKGHATVSATVKFPETGRAITMGVEHGLWKMVADKKTGEILGSTILGPRADDLIHEVYLVKHLGKTISELADMTSHFGGYHPTLSEQFFNVIKMLDAQMQ